MESKTMTWQDALANMIGCFYIDKNGVFDILYQRYPPAAIMGGVVFCDVDQHYKPDVLDMIVLYFVANAMLNDGINIGVDNKGNTIVQSVDLPSTMYIGTAERRNMFQQADPNYSKELTVCADKLNDSTIQDILNGLGYEHIKTRPNQISDLMTTFYKRLSAFLWRI